MIPVPPAIQRIPWKLIALLSAITGFGLLVLYSAAGGNASPWALQQGTRFAIFLTMALAIGRIPLRFFEDFSYLGYLGVAVLLVAVELLGFVGGGSQRWLNLGFMNLQPSELMKVAIVLALARFYTQLPPGETRSWTALWPALVMIGIPAALVMLQPDLGTALAICASGAIVMFVAGLPLWWFGSAVIAGAAALPILFSMLHDYQQKRVLIFLDPESDPLGAGYHISQSKIAIGSGGISGKGFLNGSQSHLDYLPEGHTDFIFATMAEEWGLIGGLALMFGFFLLLRWSTRVAMNARTRFGQLVATGLTMTIFFYIAINLMMVMGLAPVVGIPLPLFSYGGSSMLTIMTCVGIILAIENDSRTGVRRFH
ncbi:MULTISPECIES: rod shape-determining protein RodA [Sphingopyxis]|uniref:rod shape-determining protein RodA n=1 Tax=Sphingopyxis TaxID=165697 RepID=UPI00086EECE8|nr:MULTISPECIES: rod shape-determining protein RodA [Sphingopyxis]APW74204.1 rod shape-determining protein RodA [Sphingopyxis granuli]AVA14086.1 rod shape-determining protein RodA [Sphingopyxis sp. MG]ODU27868.1 MAG: rod shape-determining protein RodA [Sphingopyxis sp. SCN 67-31]QUM70805.1 rod shape-determining protein RodA [Sphingopyxis granuli]